MITDFTRVLPNVLLLKHLTLPEHLDEIGERIITKYFPNRTMDENTHSNAVDVFKSYSMYFNKTIKKKN